MLERLIADGLAGRFPAEEVDIQDWKEMLKRAQDLQLKLRKRLNQRAARSAAPAMAEERGEESWAPMEMEYKCPRRMARFAKKASWQRHRAAQCYQEIAERTRKVPLPGPEKSLLRYRGKASTELAPLTCYADLEVYSTPAPTVHIAQQQPARQTVAASSCYVAVGRCGYVPPEELTTSGTATSTTPSAPC